MKLPEPDLIFEHLYPLRKRRTKLGDGGEVFSPSYQLIKVEDSIYKIISILNERGHRALIIGGAVRDALLGIAPKDVDIEVYKISYEELEKVLSQYGKVDLVGQTFGVILFKPDGSDMTYDFSIPRRENKVGVGHKGFKIFFDKDMTIKDAGSRRDFSWSALAYDPLENKIYDYFGGVKDLEDKVIHHTSEAFNEDALRVLRALQFQSRFDFSIHPDTLVEMRKMVASEDFDDLPRERLFGEWSKWGIKGKRHDLIFQFMHDTGLIEKYPELKALRETPQDHIYHPEGNVEIHTIMTLAEMDKIIEREGIVGEEKLILVMAILLHDVGKNATTKEEMKKGRMTITSNGHEALGGDMCREFLPRIGFHEELINPIANIVANHLAGVSISQIPNRSGQLKAVKKLSRRLHPATIHQLLYVMEADSRGRGGVHQEVTGAAIIKELAEEADIQNKPYEPILMGRHLIEEGLKPSSKFGEIIRASFEAQESGAFNDIEGAKEWLRGYLNNPPVMEKGGEVSEKNLISSGSTRFVYDIGEGRVKKVANNKKGIEQNKNEVEISKDSGSDIITKVYDHSPSYEWIVSEKADLASEESLWNYFNGFSFWDIEFYVWSKQKQGTAKHKRIINDSFVKELISLKEKYNLDTDDLSNRKNYGYVDGRLKLIDYGMTEELRRRLYSLADGGEVDAAINKMITLGLSKNNPSMVKTAKFIADFDLQKDTLIKARYDDLKYWVKEAIPSKNYEALPDWRDKLKSDDPKNFLNTIYWESHGDVIGRIPKYAANLEKQFNKANISDPEVSEWVKDYIKRLKDFIPLAEKFEAMKSRIGKKEVSKEVKESQQRQDAYAKIYAFMPSVNKEILSKLVEDITKSFKPFEDEIYEKMDERYRRLIEVYSAKKEAIRASVVFKDISFYDEIFNFEETYIKREKVTKTYRGSLRTYETWEDFSYLKGFIKKQNWEDVLDVKLKSIIEGFRVELLFTIMEKFEKITEPIQEYELLDIRSGYKGFEGVFKFKFKNGSSFIFETQAIVAGGYNIQIEHLRYLSNFRNAILSDGTKLTDPHLAKIVENFSLKEPEKEKSKLSKSSYIIGDTSGDHTKIDVVPYINKLGQKDEKRFFVSASFIKNGIISSTKTSDRPIESYDEYISDMVERGGAKRVMANGGVTESMSIKELLKHLYKEHHDSFAIAKDLEETTPLTAEMNSERVIEMWDKELDAHFREEEERVFPRLVSMDITLTPDVDYLIQTHNKFREEIIPQVRSDKNRASVIRFASAIKEHILDEEKLFRSIMPDPYREITPEEMEKGGVASLKKKSNSVLLAPNGKTSNLTPEQYQLVRTPEFRNFFGDWQSFEEAKSLSGNIKGIYKGTFKDTPEQILFEIAQQANTGEDQRQASVKMVGGELVRLALKIYPDVKFGDDFYPAVSKVVDQNGEPLIVYHGSKEQFTEFKKEYIGKNTSAEMIEHHGKGFYFSKSRISETGYGKYEYPAFLNLRQNDVDGIFPEPHFGVAYYVAFHPEQIKLADGTNKTFDPRNPDIRYEKGGAVEGKIPSELFNEYGDLRKVNKYIRERYPKLYAVQGNGYLYWDSDDNKLQSGLATIYSSSVEGGGFAKASHQSIGAWLKSADDVMAEISKNKRRGYSDGGEINETNYFHNTKGEFEIINKEEYDSVDAEEFVSSFGSRYKVKNGMLYRGADHWGVFGTVIWNLKNKEYVGDSFEGELDAGMDGYDKPIYAKIPFRSMSPNKGAVVNEDALVKVWVSMTTEPAREGVTLFIEVHPSLSIDDVKNVVTGKHPDYAYFKYKGARHGRD